MEIYSIENLTFAYPEQDNVSLDSISIKINQGEFVVLCGPSGCGKSTLLRQLKTVLTPHGVKSGKIYFQGISLDDVDQQNQSSSIGFVMQNPDNQIVTDKVWHELAFGLESLGYDTQTIRLRVAEMASYFGIQNWFYKNVVDLSGGQKQLLNLAAIMAMQPSVLILDEPTSQLDPIAAGEFLVTIGKINRDLGTTIILTEHRLEDALPLADRAIIMDNGKVIADGLPKEVGQELGKNHHKMFLSMPVPMRVYLGVENTLECPITVREGREWLDNISKEKNIELQTEKENLYEENKISIEIKEAWFKYEKHLPDIVKGVSIKAHEGEFLAILGGNGTGKSTTLSLMSGINKPYRGKVYVKGEELSKIPNEKKYNKLLGVLPQNPQSLFVKKTVLLDLYEVLQGKEISGKDKDYKIRKIAKLCRLDFLLDRHPYDLSGGEQQRAALAKILLLEPQILLLDEPTKGLDAEFKQVFADILKQLLKNNITIVMVSHDIEFCASYAHRCALFFDGNIVTEGEPIEFFSGNSFYTTSANRMARHINSKIITAEEIIKVCGGNIDYNYIKDDKNDNKDKDEYNYSEDLEEDVEGKSKLDINKKVTKILTLCVTFIVMYFTMREIYPFLSKIAWSSLTGNLNSLEILYGYNQWAYVVYSILFIVSATIFVKTIFKRSAPPKEVILQIDKEYRKLSKRTIISAVLILIFIPLTIFIGVYYLGDRKYYFISLLIILETMLPFVMIFESRKPQARELVIISVLCAIGVAGRAAFFMLPQFKPVSAIVIISSVAFGGETGFLVGAGTMFLSNVMFGQGPWTPWQMFAMGIIGFLSGVLFRKGILRRDKLSLAIFGGISVFFIYGGIMNPASVLMFQSNVTWPMIVTSWVTGAPFDLIHAFATVYFILIMGEPMLEKLDRIKVKYGLISA